MKSFLWILPKQKYKMSYVVVQQLCVIIISSFFVGAPPKPNVLIKIQQNNIRISRPFEINYKAITCVTERSLWYKTDWTKSLQGSMYVSDIIFSFYLQISYIHILNNLKLTDAWFPWSVKFKAFMARATVTALSVTADLRTIVLTFTFVDI